MRSMIGDHQDEAFRYGRACLAFPSLSISKDWLSGVSRLPGLFMGYELRDWVTQHTVTLVSPLLWVSLGGEINTSA